ncbi:MAG: hypothetical protein CMH81_05685 [Nitrospiraceae bacterium]|nr:hypothetical protein [Nitrospiraceae bacterium]
MKRDRCGVKTEFIHTVQYKDKNQVSDFAKLGLVSLTSSQGGVSAMATNVASQHLDEEYAN